MASNNTVRRIAAAPDPEQPIGRNLYLDRKNRMIYVSPLLKEALYLPKYDYRKFNRYKSRFLVPVAAFMVLATTMSSWFSMPVWVSVVLALLIFAGMEFSFYRFLRTLTVVKNFEKDKAVSTVDTVISSDMRTKCWLKIILYVLLGVLLVINGYQQHYDLWVLVCCWLAMAYCLYTAGKLLIMLIRSPKN